MIFQCSTSFEKSVGKTFSIFHYLTKLMLGPKFSSVFKFIYVKMEILRNILLINKFNPFE